MISVVIPLCNEESNLKVLYDRLIPSLKKIDSSYEIIFIDDGSTDNSLTVLKKLSEHDKQIRIFSFRRNLGKAEALHFGFQKVQGDYVVTLDADLQDRPEEIPKLYAKLQEGYDVVSGWRKNRKDASKMVSASKLFNRIMNHIWKLQIHDYNCGLKMYVRDAVMNLNLYGGMHRFIPLLVHQQGFTVTEVEVHHDKRLSGESKYKFSKTWKDLPDLFSVFFLTRFGKRPMHFFGFIGNILSSIGILFLAYLTILHYFFHVTVGTRPLWSIGILFTLVGLQVSITGFLADLMIHITQGNSSEQMKAYVKYSTEKK
jgi:glycosyltransferase involved in cell wall biosynthesis